MVINNYLKENSALLRVICKDASKSGEILKEGKEYFVIAIIKDGVDYKQTQQSGYILGGCQYPYIWSETRFEITEAVSEKVIKESKPMPEASPEGIRTNMENLLKMYERDGVDLRMEYRRCIEGQELIVKFNYKDIG